MDLQIGTSGFSYKSWKGGFYPARLPEKKMLEHYASRLPAVEINNTFYRLPKASVLEGWAGRVPDGFHFAIKASRRVTHFKRLKDPGDETDYLLQTVRSLGDRLGALLFQLPPNLGCDLARLETFLARLPGDLPAAFEFRHASWEGPAVDALLAARGAVRVVADTDERPFEGDLPAGAWGYVRLRRSDYRAEDLADWAARLRTSGWARACVFFKHETTGPAWAAELLARASRKPAAARPARAARKTG